MMVPMALLCLWFERHRPFPLLATGAGFLAAFAAIYAVAPVWSELVIQSVYVNPLGFRHLDFGTVSMLTRFFQPERLILVAMIAAALGRAAWTLRERRDDQALIVAVAAASQLALIVVDPMPYEYVYGWAMIPVLIGLPGPDHLKVVGALGFAAMIVAAALAYPFVKGRPPHTPIRFFD